MSENLFSTKRETVLTGDQMLENAIRLKNERRQNLSSLTEANKLSETNKDLTATMESANLESELEVQRSAALEHAQYMQGSRNLAMQRLNMRNRLIQEGMELVTNSVIGQIIFESYWLDDAVKERQVEQITESISGTMQYLEEKCMESKVPVAKQNRYLLNVQDVIRDIVTEAAERICEEAKKENSAFAEFALNEAEEDKLDEKLSDLGTDEIVGLIKDKVANVIQDEQTKQKEKAEMFDEIDNQTSEEVPEDGEDAAAESAIPMEISLESALNFDKTDIRYTSNERYVASILENGATISIMEDPTWTEFMSCISLLSKKIRNIIMTGGCEGYCCAEKLIDELMNQLSAVPEDVPGNVKEQIMTMVGIIYGAVPADEVIISRFGKNLGSPDLSSNNEAVNMTTVSWIDLFVNIKTNLSSIKAYLHEKCCDVKDTNSEAVPVAPVKTLESLVAEKRMRNFNRGIGSTLFESLMLGNLAQTEHIVTEGTATATSEEIEDAALIESLLQYTVFETLDTIGLFKFRLNDIKGIKQDYVKGITEGTTPVYGESDSRTMSNGTDKTGKKKIRINTRKMKKSAE